MMKLAKSLVVLLFCTLFFLKACAEEDLIQRVTQHDLGGVKNYISGTPPASRPSFTKIFRVPEVVDGELITVYYGLQRYKDSVGNFDRFTIDRSLDGGMTYTGNPKVWLSAADLEGVGTVPGRDYTLSQFRSLKAFVCPSTGRPTLWAKRHQGDINGTTTATKELFNATLTDPNAPCDTKPDAVKIRYPYGYESGDLADIKTEDAAYIISTERTDHGLSIIKLKDDCSDIEDEGPFQYLFWNLPNGQRDKREAPSYFFRDGYHFILTSGVSGWMPNQHKYTYATSLSGPWSELVEIGDSTAFHSQVFYPKNIDATDGSGNSTRLFSGNRNPQIWRGQDGRVSWNPIYFNSPIDLTVNYYDFIDINYTRGEVKGQYFDLGQKFDVSSVELVGHPTTNVDALIDGLETTAWYKGNVDGMDEILFDLGEVKMIKGVKLRQYDSFDQPGRVETKVFRIRIEVGDGTNFTTVYEDILPTMKFLQALDTTDAQGRYVKIIRLETHNGGNDNLKKHFGFYEVALWGGDAETTPQVDEDFETGALPSSWVIDDAPSTQASVVIDPYGEKGQVLRLTDSNSSAAVEARTSFVQQHGTGMTFSIDFNFASVGTEESISLQQDSKRSVRIVNSTASQGLVLRPRLGDEFFLSEIQPGQWHRLEISFSTDHDMADIFLDGQIVRGGAKFSEFGRFINVVGLSTDPESVGGEAYFDNVFLSGPMTSNPSQIPPSDILFSDDFETGMDGWSAASGSWSTIQDGGDYSLDNGSSRGISIISAGDTSWTDYTYSAKVRRRTEKAGLLGRYQNSNRYYHFALRNSGIFFLDINDNGTYTRLASGSFASSSSIYHDLSLDFRGNRIIASIDGNQVADVIDNTIASGSIGFRVSNRNSRIDDVTVVRDNN